MNADQTLSRIEERLGFVPPFFAPAAADAHALEELWRQTESCYLDNPLPALFKEKLAALLGRYCEVPYCFVCHSCTLRPLGMTGPDVLALLTQRHPSDEIIGRSLARLGVDGHAIELPANAADEHDLFVLASAVYASGSLASASRSQLRRRLSPADYRSLIVFTSYNRMCHEWMAAHPEVSFELDERYLRNRDVLVAEAPGIAELFAHPLAAEQRERTRRIEELASARNAEAPRSMVIAEQRFADVVADLRKRVTAALSSANEKEKLAAELGRTAAFAQELLAIVSHDLRDPLNTMSMGASLILRLESSNEATVETARRMMRGARRAERLIHDLLDFSQARAGGGIPIHVRPADLHRVVRSVVEEVQVLHPARTMVVTGEGDGSGEWDADRLGQVVSNLLNNAIAHGLDDAPIEIATRGEHERMTLVIRNRNRSGPIPADLLPNLFEPFKRGSDRKMSSTRSVGLGLYIVSEIVRGHRGSVGVISAGEHTTFTVELPRNSAPVQRTR